MSTPTFPAEMDGSSAPKAAPAAKPAAGGTEYMVLRLHPESNSWKESETPCWAQSAHEAVRKASDGKAGTYVAVPARSFKPVTVKVETVQRVTLDDA